MTQNDTEIVEKVVRLYFEGKTVREAIRQAISENKEDKYEQSCVSRKIN